MYQWGVAMLLSVQGDFKILCTPWYTCSSLIGHKRLTYISVVSVASEADDAKDLEYTYSTLQCIIYAMKYLVPTMAQLPMPDGLATTPPLNLQAISLPSSHGLQLEILV